MSEDQPPLTRIVMGRIVPSAGVWDLDGLHTHTGFGIRHLLTLMRGRFRQQTGTLVIAEDPTKSTVQVTIDAASIDTAHPKADETVRSEMLLDVENHPTITFSSTAIHPAENGRWTVVGDLTIKGVTAEVELDTEFLGAVYHPFGGTPKMSFSASTSIARSTFGVGGNFEVPGADGVLVVGNTIDLQIDVEADLAEGQNG